MFSPLSRAAYVALILLYTVLHPSPVEAQDADEKAKIEAIIDDYLQKNPDVVIRAIQEFQRRQTVAEMAPKISAYREFLEQDKSYPVLGNPNGSITLVEFFDYRCGYCKRNFPAILKILEDNPDVRFIARQFPILDRAGEKAMSMLASKAALAAHKQGKFGVFHAALMTLDGSLTEDRLYSTARKMGLNVDILKADMTDERIDTVIKQTIEIGRDIGFTGTPSYFVGDDVAQGAVGYIRLQQAINREREAQKQSGR